jgi:CDP-glucose 4,6-dehydratase
VEGLGVTPDFWRGKAVLVTGSTGFKGSWLSYWLWKLGAKVYGLALPPDTKPSLYVSARLAEVVPTQYVDIRSYDDVARVVAERPFELVFHLAAQPLVRASYEQPLLTYAVNVMGTAHILEAVRNAKVARAVICVTTDKCYENREWVWPYRENDRLGGRDPYSSSKACAEIVASAYAQSYFSVGGTPCVTTARAGNVVGGGDWSEDRIVPDLMRAFDAGETAAVRNPDAVRPWQSVLDALHGYLLLAERAYLEPKEFAEAWNFGPEPGAERPVRAIADALKAAWDGAAGWQHRAPVDAPHEARTLRLDSSKARARLGWREMLPVDEALARIARWYQAYYRGTDARTLMDDDLDDFERRMRHSS